MQLAAQVLDELDDEDIGFGLVDEKKAPAVAKKLGKLGIHIAGKKTKKKNL